MTLSMPPANRGAVTRQGGDGQCPRDPLFALAPVMSNGCRWRVRADVGLRPSARATHPEGDAVAGLGYLRGACPGGFPAQRRRAALGCGGVWVRAVLGCWRRLRRKNTVAHIVRPTHTSTRFIRPPMPCIGARSVDGIQALR